MTARSINFSTVCYISKNEFFKIIKEFEEDYVFIFEFNFK